MPLCGASTNLVDPRELEAAQQDRIADRQEIAFRNSRVETTTVVEERSGRKPAVDVA